MMLFILYVVFGVANCDKEINPEQVVVARVGNTMITVADFRKNYEFGLPHLKLAPDRKRSYLDFMINEKILALEGYRLGLDKSNDVQQLEKELLEELLVEEFFIKEIHEKIKITPEEIQQALTRSKVSWKCRYWFEPTPELAHLVCRAMRQRGYADVVADILRSNPEVNFKTQDFETGYLTWLDVPPELLEAIKDLPRGEISDPVELNGAYFIFQIVDIRRQALTESEIQTKASSMQQALFYRKVTEQARRFVSEYMTPKNVVTSGEALAILADGLAAWQKKQKKENNDITAAVASADENEPALLLLKENLTKTLVTFSDGSWSIKDFLEQYNVNSFKPDQGDQQQFRSQLSQEIAIKVRNHYFVMEAKKRRYHTSPSVQQQLQVWRDKWVYDAARTCITRDLKVSADQARTYFDKFKDRYKIRMEDTPTFEDFQRQARRDAYIQLTRAFLEKQVDQLKDRYPVMIYQAVLDTITTIDSQKSRWLTLQVFKRSSNRPAVPVVDPAWGL